MKEKPIRVLQFAPIMQAAGIENFIMNLYRNIDRNKVQFDFIVHSKKRGFYDDEIEKLGGNIYRFTLKDDKNFIKYFKDLNNFFKNHKEYKIVHGNMQSMMPIYLLFAKKHKVPVRIAHAHNSDYEKTVKGFILHLLSRLSKRYSTINFACSDKAGKYLFGKKEFLFIPNAIDTKKFKFDLNMRNETRKELKIKDDEVLIGNIGRFELQKNHEKIVDIFNEYLKINSNSKLLLIGAGKLEEQIKKKTEKLGIYDKVIFAGLKKNTAPYYFAMDLFLLPSLYEGLPVVGVEAQTAGLHCIMSDTITTEVDILKQITYVDLNTSSYLWAKKIDHVLHSSIDREKAYDKMSNTNFDIIKNSKYMEGLYYKLLNKNL